VPPCPAQKAIVGREEKLGAAPLSAGQVEHVESAEPEGLQKLGANRILAVRRDDRAAVRMYFGGVAPPVRVRICDRFRLPAPRYSPNLPGRHESTRECLQQLPPPRGYEAGSGHR